MRDVLLLRGFRWIYAAFIAQVTVKTLLTAVGRTSEAHIDAHGVVALAVVELIAIAAFAIEPLETIACAVLLAVFAAAALLTLLQGEMPLRFFYYGATAIGIVLAHRRLANAPQPAVS